MGKNNASPRSENPDEVTITPFSSKEFMPTDIVYSQGFAYPHMWRIRNAWRTPVGEGYATIYAGAWANDPSKGVLIFSARADRMPYEYYVFDYLDTPGLHGSLHIIDNSNNRLLIEAEDDFTFTLNVRWITRAGSLEDLAVMATAIAPSPTETPIHPYL